MKLKLSVAFAIYLLLIGCGGEKPAPEQATIAPLPKLSAPSTVSASASFKPKELPVLGTLEGQKADQAQVFDILAAGKSQDEIPEASSAGVKPNPIAIKLGYPPKGTDVCNLPYSALIRPMFEKCFSQGMSPTDIANIVGWEGTEIASTGSTKTYEWQDGRTGSMMIVFEGDRLVSKSETGLKP